MEFLSAQVLKALLVYAVPGIVMMYVRAQFLSGKLPVSQDAILPYIVLSLIYHALIFPFASALYVSQTYQGLYAVYWVLLLFIAPALFGLLLGINIKKEWSKRLLGRMGITTAHPVDSAWDWKFGNCTESWVLAVLKDGTKWAGMLSAEGSFISTNPAERDIIIAEVYEIGDDNKWTPKGSSVWVAHGELQTIEFWTKRGDLDANRDAAATPNDG